MGDVPPPGAGHALSLVQTADGLPIAHEVHPGNTAEAKTLLPMIRGLLERYPLKRVVLVADRGLLSVSNIEELAKLQTQLKADGLNSAVSSDGVMRSIIFSSPLPRPTAAAATPSAGCPIQSQVNHASSNFTW